MTTKSIVFWVLALCQLDRVRSFGETCHIHRQGQAVSQDEISRSRQQTTSKVRGGTTQKTVFLTLKLIFKKCDF
jgi:hypothetical protein